jgi:hypothetical protein
MAVGVAESSHVYATGLYVDVIITTYTLRLVQTLSSAFTLP